MAVKRYWRKPEKTRQEGITVAQYRPGQPLDDLLAVAHAQDPDSVMAECALPGETVLVVRSVHYYDEHPSEIEYLVLVSGSWLCCSDGYENLYESSTASIEKWYEPAESGSAG